MAVENESNVVPFTAGADLRTKQYFLVKMSADNTVVLCAGTSDKCVGILENKPNNGERADVRVEGKGKCVAAGSIAAGVNVGPDANGRAATATSGAALGLVTKGAGAQDVLLEVLVRPTPY